jgi:hypothetical protein
MQKRKLGKGTLGAAAIELTFDDLRDIADAAAKITVPGKRYPNTSSE